MKLVRKYGLAAALCIAVIISFVLSIVLWSNPSYERSKKSNLSSSRSSLISNSKPLSYVYMPTKVIYTNRDGRQWILTDSNVNLISEIMKQVRKDYANRMQLVSSHSTHQYFHDLNRPKSLILDYHSDVTTKLLDSVLSGRLSKLPNRVIDRIELPLNNQRCLYLFRDQGQRVYRVSLNNHEIHGLKKILRLHLHRIPVKIKSNYGRPLIDYQGSISMPQYEYLINKQTQNYCVMHLLNGGQRIVRTRRHARTVYSDEANRQLIFDKYQNATFVNDQPRRWGSFNHNLDWSYRYLNQLNLSLNDVHYFDFDPKSKSITYRGFIEGFPIFNPTQLGAVSLQHRNGELRSNYSLESLQIPIPNERKPLKLPSTKRVMMVLRSHGYKMHNVQAVEIGYEWKNAKSSKILANLIPGWFIEYNNHWINYGQLNNGALE